jgi:hypothetical protein
MDTTIISMLADYMEKTGSAAADATNLLDRQQRYLDKVTNAKEASVSALKKQAEDVAWKLAATRLPGSVDTLIKGAEQVKHASLMLCDHERSIELLNKVLDTIRVEGSKQAGLEPGRVSTPSSKRKLTADEQLMVDFNFKID